MRKFCIINTCGREDCGNHEQVHEDGAYYLVQDVDPHLAAIEEADNIWHEQTRLQTEALNARIAELELALAQIKNSCVDDDDKANELFRLSPAELRKIAINALMER